MPELDAAVGSESDETAPTDPVQLIKYHARQRAAARQKLDELANVVHGNISFSNYDEEWGNHAEKEFDRYSELTDAVLKSAPPSSPAGAVPDLGSDPRDQLVARLGDLHCSREYAQADMQRLYRETGGDIAALTATIERAAQEEFARMCAVVDAVRSGQPAPRTRMSALDPTHLGYRKLNKWETPDAGSA